MNSSVEKSRIFNRSSEPKKLPIFLICVMSIAAFGPYIWGSIRTEQLAVYGLLLLMFPAVVTKFNPQGGLRLFVPWILYIVIGTLGVIAPFSAMPYESGSALAGYDNIIAPLAIMLLIWTFVPSWQAKDLLILLAKIITVAMAVNGLISVAVMIWDLESILRPFWGSAESTVTVAQNAGTMGRFTGIFNQPAEAGALYGIAGVSAIFAWKERPLLLALLLPVIIVGGLISVSKIFVLGGIPVIVFYWLWSSWSAKNLIYFFGSMLILIGIMRSELLAEWSGLSYLQRLFFTDDQSLVELYGAGRFDEGSSFFAVVSAALTVSPLAGVGVAGWQVPYDGAIAEFLVTGGLVGLTLLGVVFASMLSLALCRGADLDLKVFSFLLFILTLGSSLGFSPLTANRVSTITWMFIALTVLAIRYSRTGIQQKNIHFHSLKNKYNHTVKINY